MNRLFQVLISLLVIAIAVPAIVSAASMTNKQLKIASMLSDKEKKDLAKQAGMNINASQGRGASQQIRAQTPPATVEPFDAELLAKPSSIERSMHKRLSNFSKYIDDDKQQQAVNGDKKQQAVNGDKKQQAVNGDKKQQAVNGELMNGDIRLQSAWGDRLQIKKRQVSNELLQYGYNLFAGTLTTFTPVTEIPIPPEYVLGPGDELAVQFYGSKDDTFELVVDREGIIELPPVGPLNVAGRNFMQVKALIAEKIHQIIVGASVSVSMGRLRSMRVFVLGDVNNPGSYLVSGLSTISNALFISGGVSKQGSLRHVILKRSGKNVAELDLYDFLLKGDSGHDLRLQPGDVIFVPPIGNVIGVAGEVVRPGIYELKKGRSYRTGDILELAGGRLATADIRHVQIDRITTAGDSSLIDLDLSVKKGAVVGNGDLMLIYPVPGIKSKLVHLNGHVKRPGTFGLKEKMYLSDLIPSKHGLLPSVFLDYLIIQRADPLTGELTLLQPPLGKMLRDGYKSENPELHAGDRIFVLSNKAMKPLASVIVQGAVQVPGEYPLGKNMRIADLFMAAGGPQEEAYLKEAELTRYEVLNGERRISSHIPIDLTEVLAGNPDANIVLAADDVLMVRSISNWRPSEQVELKGEVVFPGVYTIEAGETIEQLLQRAGGLTDKAYVAAAFFTRESIKEEQQKQMDEAASRLQREISQLEVANNSIKNTSVLTAKQRGLTAAKNVLETLLGLKPQGRLLIDMDSNGKLKGGSTLKLVDGDALYIPERPDQVMVMGEVYNRTAMLYRQNLERDDILDLAGGMTAMADEDKIYIIRVNGYVDSNSGWERNNNIYPGDTVVVPPKLERFNLLDSTLDWTKVMMQIGIFSASMTAIGVF